MPLSSQQSGIGIGIFNDNVDENQTTTNHDGLQNQGMDIASCPCLVGPGTQSIDRTILSN